jgi:hypothetical protein
MFMSTRLKNFVATTIAAAALVMPAAAAAGPGHDHGGEAGPAITHSALPRFAAVSEAFELVGIIDGRRIALYLDRFADNSPVKDGKVELELGGTKLAVTSRGEGQFEAELAQELVPGTYPVTAVVVSDRESDLLAGNLDMHGNEPLASAPQVHKWTSVAGAASAILLTMAGCAWLMRRTLRKRSFQNGGFA